MTISDESMLVAARAGYNEVRALMGFPTDYDGASKGVREAYAIFARAALEAAAPHMPRTITTAAERATVEPGAIAVDTDGNAWNRGTGSWVSTGGDTPPLYDDMDYTLTILREGGAKDRRMT